MGRVGRAIDQFDMDDWVDQNFSDYKPTNKPDIIRVQCPICNDYKYRMYIHTGKKIFWCHNCSTGRDKNVLDLIGFVEDKTKFQVIQDLLRILRPSHEEFKKVIEDLYEPPVIEEEDLSILNLKPVGLPLHTHRVHTKVKVNSLMKGKVERLHKIAKGYLAERNVLGPLAYRHHLHLCYAGRYQNRIIFPAFMNGVMVSWVARTLEEDSTGQKYMNPLDVDQGSVLWNFDVARSYDEVVLCEGVFDALRVGDDAIASFGKNVTPKQLAIVNKYWKKVVFLLDPDAVKKTYELTKEMTVPCRVVTLPAKKDAGSMPTEVLRKKIKEAPPLHSLDDFSQKVLALMNL